MLIPIWLGTTAVYRASLPFDSIAQWDKNLELKLPVKLVVYVGDHWTREEDAQDFHVKFEPRLKRTIEQAEYSGQTRIRWALSVQSVQWKPTKAETKLSSWELMKELDVRNQDNSETYHLYLAPTLSGKSINLEFGSTRNALLQIPDINDLGKVVSVASDVMAAYLMQQLSSLTRVLKQDDSNMRVLKHASSYLVTFNLMNGNTRNRLYEWDIETAMKTHFGVLLNRLRLLTDIKVAARIEEYASLKIDPSMVRINNKTEYQLEYQQLPHVVNFADWNIGNTMFNGSEINFLLYLPARELKPLKMAAGDVVQEGDSIQNAILLPRWGGLVIYNDAEKAKLSNQDLKAPFQIFVQQLRDLFGVEPAWPESDLNQKLAKVYSLSFQKRYYAERISLWELDQLLRRKLVGNLRDSAETLQAFRRMIVKLTNMVVADHIKDKVERALQQLELAHQYSTSSSRMSLLDGYRASKQSYEEARAAFFDPTMTSMLYFPDEHILAVYAPLLLPIFVPLIVSLRRSIRRGIYGTD